MDVGKSHREPLGRTLLQPAPLPQAQAHESSLTALSPELRASRTSARRARPHESSPDETVGRRHYARLRSLLFRMDPECAHELTLRALSLASRSRATSGWLRALSEGTPDPSLAVTSFGLTFPNPIGLAAGFDKNAVAVPALASLGFGTIEVGSVTAVPRMGNPRPRLFRLTEDEALINRMGLNNVGSAVVAARLRRAKRMHAGVLPPIGVSVAWSGLGAIEDAHLDYRDALCDVWDVADYIVLNVSSPNTSGLRGLQDPRRLSRLLRTARELGRTLGEKPILVKLAPDEPDESLVLTVKAAADEGAAGFVATNTTVRRPRLTSDKAVEGGGLSGRPVASRSLSVLGLIVSTTDLPVVSGGGVFDAEDARRRLDAGAVLVQLYSSLVFRGPALPGILTRELAANPPVSRPRGNGIRPGVREPVAAGPRATQVPAP